MGGGGWQGCVRPWRRCRVQEVLSGGGNKVSKSIDSQSILCALYCSSPSQSALICCGFAAVRSHGYAFAPGGVAGRCAERQPQRGLARRILNLDSERAYMVMPYWR